MTQAAIKLPNRSHMSYCNSIYHAFSHSA